MARTIETLLANAQRLRAQVPMLIVSGSKHLLPKWYREIARCERRAKVLAARRNREFSEWLGAHEVGEKVSA